MRTCKTCPNPVQGKAVYCAECAKKRQAISDKASKQRRGKAPPRPIGGPQTDLRWMGKFTDYAKSGLTYAEYQRREMKL